MRFRKLKRFVLIFLMAIFGVVVLLFAIINLPFSQKFATRQVNQILEQSHVPIHIHAIKRILPTSVKVQGVAITGLSGDTIIYAGELHANCRLLALSRKKVVLRDLDLEQATVYLARNNNTGKINIASAFQSGKQADSPKQKKGKANWEISVKEGELTGITFRMNDAVSGVHIAQDVSAIKLKKFLISLAERSISAHTLDLSGVDGGIQLSPSEGSVSENNSSPPWTFELLNLIMNHVGFSFHQPANEFKLDVALEKGRIKAKTWTFFLK